MITIIYLIKGDSMTVVDASIGVAMDILLVYVIFGQST